MASLRRINQDDLRNHNLSVVIDTLLRASGPMSRADLAKETGLTKATMSLLVSLLIDAGVVKEGEPQNSASYGRPSTPLMLGGGKVCGIGMQVNTDGYGCMALDINHDILRHEWVDADMSGVEPDVVFGKLDAMVKAMAEDLESKRCIIAGVSCALPGLVTSDKRLLMARNLGWENVDLTTFDVMRGYDVTPCNEAKLAAIAQIPGYACARADVFDGVDCADSFLYLSCDIGIGGAIVRDGEIVSGSHGFAGEIGHVSVSLDGPLCGCGRRGCLETYAGRRALVEASGVAEKNAASSGEALERLLDAWHSHDVRTVEAVGRAIDALASAIRTESGRCRYRAAGRLVDRFRAVLLRNARKPFGIAGLGGVGHAGERVHPVGGRPSGVVRCRGSRLAQIHRQSTDVHHRQSMIPERRRNVTRAH